MDAPPLTGCYSYCDRAMQASHCLQFDECPDGQYRDANGYCWTGWKNGQNWQRTKAPNEDECIAQKRLTICTTWSSCHQCAMCDNLPPSPPVPPSPSPLAPPNCATRCGGWSASWEHKCSKPALRPPTRGASRSACASDARMPQSHAALACFRTTHSIPRQSPHASAFSRLVQGIHIALAAHSAPRRRPRPPPPL